MSAAITAGRSSSGQPGDVFEDERFVRRADGLDLVRQAGGDVFALAIGDERDALVRLNVEAHANGIARAGGEVLVESRQHLPRL
jgi:hypothetical protein